VTTLDNLPAVVSRDEWTAARNELLRKEKELTRARDRLNAERRRLPMVRIDKPYSFTKDRTERWACSTCSRAGPSW